MSSGSETLDLEKLAAIKKSRRMLAAVGFVSIVLSVSFAVLVFYFFRSYSPKAYQNSFDSVKIGMTTSEVTELMGSGSRQGYESDGQIKYTWMMRHSISATNMRYEVRYDFENFDANSKQSGLRKFRPTKITIYSFHFWIKDNKLVKKEAVVERVL